MRLFRGGGIDVVLLLLPSSSLFSLSFLAFFVLFYAISDHTRNSGLPLFQCPAYIVPSLLALLHATPRITFLEVFGFVDLVLSKPDLLSFTSLHPPRATPLSSPAS
jgi:hypothetical protein